ncbi:MAG: aminotransferase class I/II-fold pyridoxal phosphate-dependent enzyme, partial [Oscillospiraceae bacterium]|nr:aminotransferase class I/II-fold pyridoxal phosphate-dependent enzyme [Oscillospiraceae bacterium]
MDYQKLLNQTVQEIKPSGIRKYFDLAHQMKDVISLGVGEPDFATPWEIRRAGIDSLKERKTWYTANRGLEKLCCAISKYYMERFGLCYAPNAEIMVTVGGSEALDLAIRALVSPGDEVIIPQPSFVCYEP